MAEMPRYISHFSHRHPLKLHKKYQGMGWGEHRCYLCGSQIGFVPIYACAECRFFVHVICSAKYQQRLRHPFHPQHFLSLIGSRVSAERRLRCSACYRYFSDSAYHCSDCNFSLHQKCSKLQLSSKISEAQLKLQEYHGHPLFFCDPPPDESDYFYYYKCSICPRTIFTNQLVIVCLVCKSLLHESCVFPVKIKHQFHLMHPLSLVGEYTYHCNVCSDESHVAYHCSACDFSLDLWCANLKPTSGNSELQFLSLAHLHHLIECTNQKRERRCYGCFKPIEDFIYVCLTCRCLLDKRCAQLLPEVTHPFHPLHPLKLVDRKKQEKQFWCRGCNEKIDGYLNYECPNGNCDFRLCPLCAGVKPLATVKTRIHEHPTIFLTRKLGIDSFFICKTCHTTCEGHFFRCFECENFNLHLECFPLLPQVIKHDCHCDPLTLTRSKFKTDSDEDSEDEFYCSACEELRNIDDPTYCCKECYFVAHVHCVFSEILQSLEAESTAPSHASSKTSQSLVTTQNEPSPSVPSFGPTESVPLSSQAPQLPVSIQPSQSLAPSSELPHSHHRSPFSKPNESLPTSTRSAAPFPASIKPSQSLPLSNKPSALVPSPGMSQLFSPSSEPIEPLAPLSQASQLPLSEMSQSLPPPSNELAPFEPSFHQPQAISTASEPTTSLSSSEPITSLPSSSQAPQIPVSHLSSDLTPLVPSQSKSSSLEPTKPLPPSYRAPSTSPAHEPSSSTTCFFPLRKTLPHLLRRCLRK